MTALLAFPVPMALQRAPGRLQPSPSAWRAVALCSALWLAGCSALPVPPQRPAQYDFGPAADPVVASAGTPAPKGATVALADVESTGLSEGNTAVLYRLMYADAQQLRPYALARWSQPPAQLLQQRVRHYLGLSRAVVSSNDGSAMAGKQPPQLRLELEEFSQHFTSNTASAARVRVRATLLDSTSAGDAVIGQRVFTVQRPSASADAPGGVAAMAQASDQLAQDVAQWVDMALR